jgi:hypothetical protein
VVGVVGMPMSGPTTRGLFSFRAENAGDCDCDNPKHPDSIEVRSRDGLVRGVAGIVAAVAPFVVLTPRAADMSVGGVNVESSSSAWRCLLPPAVSIVMQSSRSERRSRVRRYEEVHCLQMLRG